MILFFEKPDGLRLAIDCDSIISIDESYDCVIINTITDAHEVINDYEDVVNEVVKWRSNNNEITYSRN